MGKQRSLRFASLDEIALDADRLLSTGYTRGGSWSLGQICEHLSKLMEMSVQGFPSHMPRFVQKMMRWAFWKTISEHKPISMRMPGPSFLMPAQEVADATGVERLRQAIAALKAASEPLHPSPVFGPLTKEEWTTVHLWHSEHHLGFLAPQPSAATTDQSASASSSSIAS